MNLSVGYIIMTCHEGTDWAVYDYDPERDEEDERYDDKAKALVEAQKTCERLNRPGSLPARVFDFTVRTA